LTDGSARGTIRHALVGEALAGEFSLVVSNASGGFQTMANCQKLLEKAKNSPNNFRFEELCSLAKCYGWTFKPQNRTSHLIGFNPLLTREQGQRMNFQNCKGKAKPSQVRQLLASIENLSP